MDWSEGLDYGHLQLHLPEGWRHLAEGLQMPRNVLLGVLNRNRPLLILARGLRYHPSVHHCYEKGPPLAYVASEEVPPVRHLPVSEQDGAAEAPPLDRRLQSRIFDRITVALRQLVAQLRGALKGAFRHDLGQCDQPSSN